MKKILLGMSVLAVTAFTSCSKDYTCECTITHREKSAEVMGQSIDSTKEETNTFTVKGKEEDAESTCKESEYEMVHTGGIDAGMVSVDMTYTITSKCKLK